MGQELAHLTRTAWQREPIILISVIGAIIGPLGVITMPSFSQRTFKDIRDFPKEYPWPETADERRKPVLEVKVPEIDDPVRTWFLKQFEDDLF
ncbi:hypothetical protein LOD99_4306 [Oopsacas minuta]|uniref:NADH dehydrogenase [ubiquinone] 1 alpha subcomplex subunit 3 n=1 Tax=Oopsacas minuta TaxID=111878 RepID=A0AAV7JUD2_9METZ|nr:hypothetical protein LOD99_4306 [Oopsacas minuta]